MIWRLEEDLEEEVEEAEAAAAVGAGLAAGPVAAAGKQTVLQPAPILSSNGVAVQEEPTLGLSSQ